MKNTVRIFLGLTFLIFCTLLAQAQFVSQWTQGAIPLPALPATCNPGLGSLVYDTVTNGLYSCTAANTWRPAGFTGNQNTWAQGTLTANTPVINHTATWNNAAVTFSNIVSNVTDTASNAASLLINLRTGGVTQFSVTKAGFGVFNSNLQIGATSRYEWNGRSRMYSSASGQINFTDNAGTTFSQLTLGPETGAGVGIYPQFVGGAAQGILIGSGNDVISFTDLGAANNGTIVYCNDCTKATPCAGAGNGALAKRLNGAWDCD